MYTLLSSCYRRFSTLLALRIVSGTWDKCILFKIFISGEDDQAEVYLVLEIINHALVNKSDTVFLKMETCLDAS